MTNTQQPQALAATPLSDIHGPLAGTVTDFAPTSAYFAIPEGLHPCTTTLVRDFAEAMAKKLRDSEIKHGWTANWMRQDWRDELASELLRHVRKGDPIDVAAYCAFAWFHGWSVAPTSPTARITEEFCQVIREMVGVATGEDADPEFDREAMKLVDSWQRRLRDARAPYDPYQGITLNLSATSGGQVATIIPYTDEDDRPDPNMAGLVMIAIGRDGAHDHVLDRIPTKAAGVICEAINRAAPQPAGMEVMTERLRQIDAHLAEGFIACPRCTEEITTSDMDVRSDIAELIDALTGLPPGHVVIEQSETLDGRIAQTVKRPDGTDYVRVLPGGDDAPRLALIYPDDLTPALMEALGVPNFKASPIAHALRDAGADIPRKSEAEQAHVLHWFVKLALQHGTGWWKVAGDEMQRIALDARQKAGEGSANG